MEAASLFQNSLFCRVISASLVCAGRRLCRELLISYPYIVKHCRCAWRPCVLIFQCNSLSFTNSVYLCYLMGENSWYRNYIYFILCIRKWSPCRRGDATSTDLTKVRAPVTHRFTQRQMTCCSHCVVMDLVDWHSPNIGALWIWLLATFCLIWFI